MMVLLTQTRFVVNPLASIMLMDLPAGLLHDLGAVVATHLAERFVAVHDGVVHDLRVGQQETAVCCNQRGCIGFDGCNITRRTKVEACW